MDEFNNDKIYIGKDSKGGERQIRHIKCIADGCFECHGNLLHKAILKYGIENFEYEELSRGFDSLEELSDAEDGFIISENALSPNGYNRTLNSHWEFSDSQARFEKILDYIPPPQEDEELRSRHNDIPDWATDDRKIRDFLLRSFPKLKTDLKQRIRAGRWLRVINLYFRMQWSHTQVAEEIGMLPKVVHGMIRGIRRSAQGRRVDGKGLSGLKPIGRPKNNSLPVKAT